MITCIKCGKWLSHDWSNLSSICQECAGELADSLFSKDWVVMAKVGLDALVDEVTGFEKVRPKDDLVNRHKKYKEDSQ